jgi:hypothetical protein
VNAIVSAIHPAPFCGDPIVFKCTPPFEGKFVATTLQRFTRGLVIVVDPDGEIRRFSSDGFDSTRSVTATLLRILDTTSYN